MTEAEKEQQRRIEQVAGRYRYASLGLTPDEVILDGEFSAADLRAIADILDEADK